MRDATRCEIRVHADENELFSGDGIRFCPVSRCIRSVCIFCLCLCLQSFLSVPYIVVCCWLLFGCNPMLICVFFSSSLPLVDFIFRSFDSLRLCALRLYGFLCMESSTSMSCRLYHFSVELQRRQRQATQRRTHHDKHISSRCSEPQSYPPPPLPPPSVRRRRRRRR